MSDERGETRLGVDVGGTFTDLVALSEGTLITTKVPSTPRDQSEGVMNAIETSDVEPATVLALAHGMTVATNALLERRGARTALVTTEGFRDVLEIARQNRPALYDLTHDRPPPLVPRDLRFMVDERMGPEGEVSALDEDSLKEGHHRCGGGGSRGGRRVPALRVHAPRAREAGGRSAAGGPARNARLFE